MTRQPSKWELEALSRQRVDCRCGLCGQLLAEDVSVKQSAKLIAKHRQEEHPEFLVKGNRDQQRGNRRIREENDEKVLRALSGGRPRTIRELRQLTGLGDLGVRSGIRRMVEDGRVEQCGSIVRGRSHDPVRYRRVA